MFIYYLDTFIVLRETQKLFFVGGKEIGKEVNADTTKYMVMSRNYNAGRIHNIKSNNRSLKG